MWAQCATGSERSVLFSMILKFLLRGERQCDASNALGAAFALAILGLRKGARDLEARTTEADSPSFNPIDRESGPQSTPAESRFLQRRHCCRAHFRGVSSPVQLCPRRPGQAVPCLRWQRSLRRKGFRWRLSKKKGSAVALQEAGRTRRIVTRRSRVAFPCLVSVLGEEPYQAEYGSSLVQTSWGNSRRLRRVRVAAADAQFAYLQPLGGLPLRQSCTRLPERISFCCQFKTRTGNARRPLRPS